jgi:ABC-type dipeptide/oligopeptide/nickel transport system ATPase component
MSTQPLLDIRNLRVAFATRGGEFVAVDGIDIACDRNEVLAIVGESGSGKSVAMLAIMGLLPWTARSPPTAWPSTARSCPRCRRASAAR